MLLCIHHALQISAYFIYLLLGASSMNFNDMLNRIKDVSPEIVIFLEREDKQLGMLILASLWETSPNSEDILHTFENNPEECIAKLKQFDGKKLLSQVPEEKAAAASSSDVAMARQMQIDALHRGKGDFANWFAVVVFLSCFAMIGVMLLHGASTINDSMRFYVLGFLQSVVMAIIGFYFGSTAPVRKQAMAPQSSVKP